MNDLIPTTTKAQILADYAKECYAIRNANIAHKIRVFQDYTQYAIETAVHPHRYSPIAVKQCATWNGRLVPLKEIVLFKGTDLGRPRKVIF